MCSTITVPTPPFRKRQLRTSGSAKLNLKATGRLPITWSRESVRSKIGRASCRDKWVEFRRVLFRSRAESDSDDLYDGVLIYLKPSLTEDEPRDVLNYHSANPTFPEETIADQWFSEAQFESYRALANHMVERICQEQDRKSVV